MEPLNIQSEENNLTPKGSERTKNPYKPTAAFVGASWLALITGAVAFCIGLWNADMALNEKGYYFTILLFGLFAVISVQKSVRDKAEGLAVTEIYYSLSWFATIASIVLLIVGLWNADLTLSEKGFYGISFVLSVFAAIAVQKNTRDAKLANEKTL
ncbi:inner membrane protein YiaA [Sphingobacterium sp. BN32]|uniref:inner membrane protein YiaA n=1 Tax=Sphingobacterium sp. BN32 TaxID=3058432 RepID=UPI00265D05D4|nr:inner membrane protein YiaA [Sphingobacterium sp. BN32]WKK58087.1 inner membrane protein YiaA [Sphingobacterium sp. BN32]